MKKLFLSTFFILFILLSVALYRTFTHTPSITGIILGEEISIDELYEKSKIYLQYGLSVKFKKLIIDFRVERGFDEREIKFVENITNDIDQIVKSDGLLTMMSIGYQF